MALVALAALVALVALLTLLALPLYVGDPDYSNIAKNTFNCLSSRMRINKL